MDYYAIQKTSEEIEAAFGQQLRDLRLRRNIDQRKLSSVRFAELLRIAVTAGTKIWPQWVGKISF